MNGARRKAPVVPPGCSFVPVRAPAQKSVNTLPCPLPAGSRLRHPCGIPFESPKRKSRLAAAFSGSWQEPAQQLLLDGRGSGLGSVDRSASGSLGGIASSLGSVNRSAGSRSSGSSSRSGSSSSARCSSDSAGSSGSSSVSGRSSSRSRCRGSGGSRCRGRSGFFLLAASGKSGGSDQGGQDERLVHDEFPLIGQNEGDSGKLSQQLRAAANERRHYRQSTQPEIIASLTQFWQTLRQLPVAPTRPEQSHFPNRVTSPGCGWENQGRTAAELPAAFRARGVAAGGHLRRRPDYCPDPVAASSSPPTRSRWGTPSGPDWRNAGNPGYGPTAAASSRGGRNGD